MNTKYLSAAILSFGIIFSAILIGNALAQNNQGNAGIDIQYPVAELGNCQNETACKSFCNKPENTGACLDFAKKHNLMGQEEIDAAKKFMSVGKGPGGCKTKDACENYCNDISRIDECVAFAEKTGMMPPKELDEAKKVMAAIKKGVKPPPCGNKKQCDAYCQSPDHMEECMKFAEAAGFMDEKEKQDSQKVLAAIKKGVKPPPCKGKEECDNYCQSPEHMEECMAFAQAAGLMSPQEMQDSQKVMAAIKKGVKPPPCKGKEECDNYCSQENHFEECTKFAEAAGFMSPEDAAMARKTGGKGPGDCHSKEQCEAFCNNPDNQETCFNFAKEHGMMKPEDIQRMGEGKQKFQEMLNQAPPQVIDCLNSSVGADKLEKFKSGSAMPPREIGDKVRECFEKIMGLPQGSPGESNGAAGPGGFQKGPGGCSSPEECKAYCDFHQDECKNFGPGNMMQQGPQMPGGGGMPGNVAPFSPGMPGTGIPCNSPEECRQLQNNMMAPGTSGFIPSGTNPFAPIINGINPQIINGIQLPAGQLPQQGDMPPQQQFMQPPQGQMPGSIMAPIMNPMMPAGQQPPTDIAPPTSPPSNIEPPSTSPLPSSSVSPKAVMGLILNFFKSLAGVK